MGAGHPAGRVRVGVPAAGGAGCNRVIQQRRQYLSQRV